MSIFKKKAILPKQHSREIIISNDELADAAFQRYFYRLERVGVPKDARCVVKLNVTSNYTKMTVEW